MNGAILYKYYCHVVLNCITVITFHSKLAVIVDAYKNNVCIQETKFDMKFSVICEGLSLEFS